MKNVKILRRLLLCACVLALCLAGTILMTQATADDSTPSTSIAGHNLSVVSNVQIGYYVTETNVPSGAERGVLIFDSPRESYTYGNYDFKLTDRYASGSYGVYYLDNLTLYRMTDVFYAVSYIKVGDDITYSRLDKYSVLEYCHRNENSTYTAEGGQATLAQLIFAIENMGTVAQKYANYKPDFFALDDVALVKLSGAHYSDGTAKEIARVGSTLTFYTDDGLEKVFTDGSGSWEARGTYATYTVPAADVTVTVRETYSLGLAYVSNGDGTCSVTGLGTCVDLDVIIPAVSPAGDTVTAIGAGAFSGEAFSIVRIPAGVGSIGARAFEGCALNGVYYEGTRADWAALLEHVGTKNTALTDAPIHCSDGDYGTGTDDEEPGIEIVDGKVTLGSWPQSEVADPSLKATLTDQAGTLPTASDSQTWTSYGYYASESNTTDYMWYIDVVYNGEKYRGVYFTSYRPYRTGYPSSADESNQDDNGYTAGTVYWFKWEPLTWRVLSSDGDTALLMCESIIDSRDYYHNYSGTRTVNEQTVYANNYEYSDIRAWLNGEFYNSAFIPEQKELILTTAVDNSAKTLYNKSYTGTPDGTYACNNTSDKVFLLSQSEVTDSALGFHNGGNNYYDSYGDSARILKTTAYARAQGVYANAADDGTGWWWLRSPGHSHGSYARSVYYDGSANNNLYSVYNTRAGVVPALQISLE